MLKLLYQFLGGKSAKGPILELFHNVGKPALMIVSVQLVTEVTSRTYEFWLEPGWTKPQLWEMIENKVNPFRGWINKSELILFDAKI